MKGEKLVLAIETASPCGGVAIVGENVLGEIVLASPETHSKRLLLACSYLLERLGLKLEDLSALAVSIGPGSFTGLRIGLATAKGLHFATGLPLVGVETLRALASNALLFPGLICPALDARRGQIYTALYKPENEDLKEILPPSLLPPEKLIPYLKGPVLFLGDGAQKFAPLFEEALGEGFRLAPAHLAHPRPSAVGFIGRKRVLSGKLDDPLKLLPLYLRPSEAELKRGKNP